MPFVEALRRKCLFPRSPLLLLSAYSWMKMCIPYHRKEDCACLLENVPILFCCCHLSALRAGPDEGPVEQSGGQMRAGLGKEGSHCGGSCATVTTERPWVGSLSEKRIHCLANASPQQEHRYRLLPAQNGGLSVHSLSGLVFFHTVLTLPTSSVSIWS